MDNKYMLISVCDREILTEIFSTFAEAQACMHKEMEEWTNIESEIFQNTEYEESDFGFGEWSAWANGRCDYNRRIICIGLEGEEND